MNNGEFTVVDDSPGNCGCLLMVMMGHLVNYGWLPILPWSVAIDICWAENRTEVLMLVSSPQFWVSIPKVWLQNIAWRWWSSSEQPPLRHQLIGASFCFYPELRLLFSVLLWELWCMMQCRPTAAIPCRFFPFQCYDSLSCLFPGLYIGGIQANLTIQMLPQQDIRGVEVSLCRILLVS